MKLGPFSAQDQVTVTTLGLEFTVAVALGTAAGYWADKRFDTLPWGTIAGVGVGFALAMYIVVKEALRQGRSGNKKEK